MINSKDLNRGIDILATLNAKIKDNESKTLLLELGYILKQELLFVQKWDEQQSSNRNRGTNIDLKKLLEDNTQLFNENRVLVESVNKMKQFIESKIPTIEDKIERILRETNSITNKIDNLETI